WQPGRAGRRSTRASAQRRRPWRGGFTRTITCEWCARSRWSRRGGPDPAQSRWQGSEGTYDVAYFGLTMDRVALARRLEARAAAFVADGLLEEIERLLAQGYDASLPALQSIGYREFVQVARGILSPSEALSILGRVTVRS